MGKTELLCTKCRGIGPHLAAMGKCHGFFRVRVGTCIIFSSYGGDGPSKLTFIQQRQNSCLFMWDTSGISSRLGRAIGTLLDMRAETQGPFPVATGILGFLSIIKCQASSLFEALISACLSRCQRVVRSPVEMSRGSRAFSRASTLDSDIPSPFEVKDQHAFNLLQGNPAFL